MDLYALLGVARTAAPAEIERAFRRLARRYHPGVNPGDRVSEVMYQQIQEAYAVLADVTRRREYDRGLSGTAPVVEAAITFEGFDFTAPAEGPRAATFSELFADVFRHAAEEAIAPSRGADIDLDVTLSFRDAARGADVPISVTRQDRCGACAGRGHVARPATNCPACGGAGTRRWARGHLVFAKACDVCAGQGRLDRETCRSCGGVGTAPRTEVITIAVPAGVETGTRMAVPGHGHAGARGGPAGDLYVTVAVGSHPFLRRHGRDLHITLPVAVHEAALGARVEVPTLDGTVRLRLPPGTASGQLLRVRGQGIGFGPSRTEEDAGDLVVEVQIVLPRDMDDESRALLAEFGRRNGADVRRELFEQA